MNARQHGRTTFRLTALAIGTAMSAAVASAVLVARMVQEYQKN